MSQRAREGGVTMFRKDGMPQEAREGGVTMFRKNGMSQGAREGGATMSGCTVCHKEPGKAVRLCMSGVGVNVSKLTGIHHLLLSSRTNVRDLNPRTSRFLPMVEMTEKWSNDRKT